MNKEYEINTVEAPSFEEYLDRYSRGVNLDMDSALDVSHQIYEQIGDAALFGSLVVHPDYYGVRELKRPTDLSVDFILEEGEVAEISEKHDIWEFDECYFADIPAFLEGEKKNFAVGLVPVEKEIFGSHSLPPIEIGEEKLYGAEKLESRHGEMPITSAETNYALKARRFTDSLLLGEHLKTNDLCDHANIHLSNQREDGELLDREKTAEEIIDYTSAQFPPYELTHNDEKRFNSFIKDVQQRVDPHIDLDDWKMIVRDIKELESEIGKNLTPALNSAD